MARLAKLLEKLADGDEFTPSLLPSVTIFRATKRISRMPNMDDPHIYVLGQGRKMGYLGDETFPIDTGNYFILSQPIPFECETIASSENPALGISIRVDLEILHELVAKFGKRPSNEGNIEVKPLRGMGSIPLNEEMALSIERLLSCLFCPNDTRVLGPSLLREVVYRALCGTYGSALFALVDHNSNFERISRALSHINANYASPISVELLAKKASMSVSAFHKAFRDITSEPPIQFLKKVRLNKARELIMQQGLRTNEVASLVGYGSISQFSREFKRYFGYPPSKTITNI
jgi:AraC-like DNA-binding protein